MNCRYGSRGFTLTEVLVSLVVLTIIVSAVYTAVRNANIAWQRGRANQMRVETGRGVIDFISRELESAVGTLWVYTGREDAELNVVDPADVGRPKYGVLWLWGTDFDPAAGPVEQVHLRSAADELHFVAPLETPGRAPRGSLVEVGYWLDGGRLWPDSGSGESYDAIPSTLADEYGGFNRPPANEAERRNLARYLADAWGDNRLRRHVYPCPVRGLYEEPLPGVSAPELPDAPELRFGYWWWLIGSPERYWSPYRDTTGMSVSSLSSDFAYAAWEQSDDSLLANNVVDVDFIYYHWYYYPRRYAWTEVDGTEHTSQEWIWGVRMVDDNPDPVPYADPYVTDDPPLDVVGPGAGMRKWPVPGPDGTQEMFPVIVVPKAGNPARLAEWANHSKRGERLLIVPEDREELYDPPNDVDPLIGQSFIIQDNAWDGDDMLIRIAGDRISKEQFADSSGTPRAYHFVVSKGEWNSLADMVYRMELDPPDWAKIFSQTVGIPAREGARTTFPGPGDMDEDWHFNNRPVPARGDAFEDYEKVGGPRTWHRKVRDVGGDGPGEPGWTGVDGLPAAVEIVLVVRDDVPGEHNMQVFNAMVYLRNSGRWGE